MTYTVAQNASFLTFASVLQKAVSFVYFTIVARLIGVENTGSFFFAVTFTTIFTVVADFGFASVLTREASKYPERSEEFFNTVFWSKLLLGVLTYGLVVMFVNLLGYNIELKTMIYLSGLTMFFDNIQSCFWSIFRAKKNLIFESAGVVISQVLTLIIGTTALFLKAPIIWLIAAYTIPSGVMVLYGGYFFKSFYRFRFQFSFNRFLFREILGFALPFALAGVLGRLYSYSDTILMSKLLTEQDLGWWSVPYKVTFAFQFIPVALSASVYPAMSSLSLTDPQKVGSLFVKAWKYLFVAVFPLSFGLIAVSEPVITRLYGVDFFPSVSVLRVLMVSLIFSYLSIISGSLLNATNHQKTQTTLVGVALVVNLILNVILIPRNGIMGAAYSALVSNVVLWNMGFYYARKYTSFEIRALFETGYKVLGVALIMAFLVYFLTLKISFFFTIPLGVLVYGALLFLSGIVDREMVQVFLEKLRIKKMV